MSCSLHGGIYTLFWHLTDKCGNFIVPLQQCKNKADLHIKNALKIFNDAKRRENNTHHTVTGGGWCTQ